MSTTPVPKLSELSARLYVAHRGHHACEADAPAASADARTSSPRRFAVTVTPPAGSVGGRVVRYTVRGGHPIDHTIDAHERHGLLCRVEVQPMAPALAELLDDFSQRVAGGAA